MVLTHHMGEKLSTSHAQSTYIFSGEQYLLKWLKWPAQVWCSYYFLGNKVLAKFVKVMSSFVLKK